MRVLNIQEFIRNLEGEEHLSLVDQKLLTRLTTYFLQRSHDSFLTTEDLDVLLACFKDRWDNIITLTDEVGNVDTYESINYTLSTAGVNRHWIALAQIISHHDQCVIPGYKILMPGITNKVDLNDLRQLPAFPSLEDYYLGDDNKTLYSISGLINFIKKGKLLTYRPGTKSSLRTYPLSLREFLSIRKKSIFAEYVNDSADPKNFWNYIKKNILPKLLRKGMLRRDLVCDVYSLVSSYYAHKDESLVHFRKALQLWDQTLQEDITDDVNHLYAISIKTETGEVPLLELLLNAFIKNGASLQEDMQAIAHWLCRLDSAFIISDPSLNVIYQTNKVGAGFGVTELLNSLNSLISGSIKGKKLDNRINRLRSSLENARIITEETVQCLREIYQLRWNMIYDTKHDYLRRDDSLNQRAYKNCPWIQLAKCLSGAGLIETNYYAFLMPTLTAEISMDPVQKRPITDFPLNHYILSDSNKTLIYLGNSVKHYKAEGTFYHCNASGNIQPFTTKERYRLQFAHAKYRTFSDKLKTSEDPPIHASTLYRLIELLNKTFFKEFLLLIDDSNIPQQSAIEMAYASFYMFLCDMDEDERMRLEQQTISYNGKLRSFREILNDVFNQECIANCSLHIAQLIIDYIPDGLLLTGQITHKSRSIFKLMCENSRRKILRDYDHIDDYEAVKRLKILYCDIITRKFEDYDFIDHYVRGRSLKNIHAFGLENNVPHEAYDLFVFLDNILKRSDFTKNCRNDYQVLMEVYIKPGLASRKVPQRTKKWLQSIQEDTLFDGARKWFDPIILLTIIIPDLQEERYKGEFSKKLTLLMDQIISLYLKSDNLLHNELQTNLLLRDFISSHPSYQQKMNTLLHDLSQKMTVPKDLQTICEDWIEFRFATEHKRHKVTRHVSFFSVIPVSPLTRVFDGHEPKSRLFNNMIATMKIRRKDEVGDVIRYCSLLYTSRGHNLRFLTGPFCPSLPFKS